jgi:hypothetical protein
LKLAQRSKLLVAQLAGLPHCRFCSVKLGAVMSIDET